MADGNDGATSVVILNMLSDLNKKVDGIITNQVTRHEFEALDKRLDTLMLKAEFQIYKEAHSQWANSELATIRAQLANIVPRLEHQTKWSEYDSDIKELKDARSSWRLVWPPIVSGILGSGLMVAAYMLHLIKP